MTRVLFLSIFVLCLQAQIVFPPDLSISRLEAVQTVQDEPQAVPLIAGKATAVRAFVRQQLRPESLVAGVTVFLRGFRDGVEIAGSPLRPLNGPVTASLQPDRGNANHSLDFILPAEWTTRGRLELRAELRLPPNTPEGPADNNNLRREIEFVAPAVDELRVYWLPVCLGGTCSGNAFQHQGLAERLLPLADSSLRYEDVPAPAITWGGGAATEASAQGLLNLLRKWRLFLEDSPLRVGYLVGWLPQGTAAFDAAARSATDRAAWIVEQQDSARNQRLLLQQVSGASVAGACESAIDDPGFDTVGARIVPAARNRALSGCAQAASMPWLSAADARVLSVPVPAARMANPAGGWIFSGTVRRNGSGALDAAYPLRTSYGAPISQPTQEACLALTGAAGAETQHCFFPFVDAAEEGTFAIRLPGAFTRVRLLINGIEAANVSASGQAPTVSITSVQEGEVWSGTRSLQWSASDPAGRALAYAVFYSVDDGANWMPLAVDVTDTQLNLETQYLLPGQVRFRVVASAGLDAGDAVSGPVEISRGGRLLLPDTTLNFGNATTGQIAERGLVVQNVGSGPLELAAAGVTADVFRFAAPAPLRVRAGTERSANLRYRPRIPGQETAEITLTTNDPDHERVTIALRGAAFERLVPNGFISPRLLDFGQVNVGQARELPFTIRNEGTAPLSVTSFSTLNARFVAVAPGGFTIAPGEERVLPARFAPLAGGPQTGTLNVATNDPSNSTLRVDLRGSGVQVFSPSIDVSASRVEFGTLTLGQTSPILPVTVRNGGTGPLSIISLTVSNPAFAVLAPATLPLTVAPGAQQVISMRFAPAAVGTQTGTLTIESSDPQRPRITVDLAGAASQQAASVEPRVSYVAPVTVRPVPAGYNIRFNITVYGSNFGPGAKVLWNGSERPTEVISSTVLRGSLSPQDVATPADAEVSVVNPPPGGGTSARYAVLVAPQTGTVPTAQIHEVGLDACPTVTMSVAVTNRLGLAITSLTNNNLVCTEDGTVVPCTPRRGLLVDSRLSVLMVMHTSASAQDLAKRTRDLSFMQQIGNRFLNSMDETTQLQVTYMDSAIRVAPSTLEFKDSVNKGALQDAVNGITTTVPQGVGTALYDAIEDGLDRLRTQVGRRKAMFLFTANENNVDLRGNRNLNLLFQRAQSDGVPIFLVPVGDGVQNQNLISLLQQFASDSGGRVLIDRGSTLSEEVNRLAHELDNMQLVDFPATRRDGLPHRIQITFTTPDGVFRAAKVYPGCPAR